MSAHTFFASVLCFGFDAVAGRLLSKDPESRFRLCGLYSPGLPDLQLFMFRYEKLMRKHLKKLQKHLTEQGILSTMYTPQWFITIYTSTFDFELVVRIWDVFLEEGLPTLFQVAIAIMCM